MDGVVEELEGVDGMAPGVVLVLSYGGRGEGISEGGEARERVMEGGLVRPLACLRLGADRSRSWEVDVYYR